MLEENTVDIAKDSAYSSVFGLTLESSAILSLWDFYQYRVANEKDSPLSLKIDTRLTNQEKDDLFARLLNIADITEDAFLFSSILRSKIKDIRAMELSDTTLKCNRIKGFFHQNNATKTRKQPHKIDSLFKHIRDAFAHGRIAFATSFWILEDKNNELTARLIITQNVLQEWKKEIELFLKGTIQEE